MRFNTRIVKHSFFGILWDSFMIFFSWFFKTFYEMNCDSWRLSEGFFKILRDYLMNPSRFCEILRHLWTFVAILWNYFRDSLILEKFQFSFSFHLNSNWSGVEWFRLLVSCPVMMIIAWRISSYLASLRKTNRSDESFVRILHPSSSQKKILKEEKERKKKEKRREEENEKIIKERKKNNKRLSLAINNHERYQRYKWFINDINDILKKTEYKIALHFALWAGS